MKNLNPNPNQGFLIVSLGLCALINLVIALDMIFLWEGAGFFKWGITNPQASEALFLWSGIHMLFFFAFPLALIYLIFKGERVGILLSAFLGWFFILVGILVGMLSQTSEKLSLDFYLHIGIGALLVFGTYILKKK